MHCCTRIFLAFLLILSAARGAIDTRIGANFIGSQYPIDSTSEPADTDGAIGPAHFVELINGRFSVYNRTNGARVFTSTDLAFWQAAGITFPLGFDVTDPRIVFDPPSGRWFAAQIDFDASASSNRFLVAVSRTSDPTAGWRGFAFKADTNAATGRFADFPTLGVDSTGIYLGANIFEPNSNIFDGVTMVSIPKADLLAATPTIANRTSFGLMPSSARGFILQPVVNRDLGSTSEAIIATTGDGTDLLPQTVLKKATIQNAGGPRATLNPTVDLAVPPYLIPFNPPQPDPLADLDDGDARISGSCFQINNLIYAVSTVNVGGTNSPLAALRWYKISATNNVVLQSGTISNSDLHFFYPSIAANSNGVVVIGFNGCSSNSFVSSYAVVGETLGGTTTFGNPLLLKAGQSSYNSDPIGTSRWGDYSATTLDPTDPNHFWTIQAYAVAPTIWATQISEIIVQDPPRLLISHTGNSVVLSWPTNNLGFNLEYSPAVPTRSWSTITEPFGIRAGTFVVTNAVTDVERIYRLRK